MLATVDNSYNGNIYTSADSGATWIERYGAGPPDSYWISVAMISDGKSLVVGAGNGYIWTGILP
jgi:hypothetical protein